jgi:hypothetical protein
LWGGVDKGLSSGYLKIKEGLVEGYLEGIQGFVESYQRAIQGLHRVSQGPADDYPGATQMFVRG